MFTAWGSLEKTLKIIGYMTCSPSITWLPGLGIGLTSTRCRLTAALRKVIFICP